MVTEFTEYDAEESLLVKDDDDDNAHIAVKTESSDEPSSSSCGQYEARLSQLEETKMFRSKKLPVMKSMTGHKQLFECHQTKTNDTFYE